MKSLAIVPALLASVFLTGGAHAAGVFLVQSGPSAPPPGTSDVLIAGAGSLITLDIVMDFTDESTLGGGFDVVYDSDVFQFQSFVNFEIGDPLLGRDPDVTDGLLESWSFTDFNPLSGPLLVGTLEFMYLGGNGEISTTATSGVGGPFVSGITNDIMSVEFNTLRTIPVPGAVWLLASGLAAFGGLKRRG